MTEFEENEEFLEPQRDYDDDEELEDYDKDEELIQKLKKLNGVKSKQHRTEVVADELDVNLNTITKKNKIRAHELLGSLKNLSNINDVKKLLQKAQKRTKLLETPLPRNISDKALRVSAYISEKKEVSKWDPIVKRNRVAEQLVFPLKQPDYSMQTASDVVRKWKPETDLEKEIAELLQSSENNIKDQKLLTQAEIKGLESMNLQEMKEKRAEFLKLKAMQTYQEAKFKRLKKIKSKRYRKILRKEKTKTEQKELEKLETENPDEFKEKLEQIQKRRMQERMSLKHKNTSKWAKQMTIYGKYNLKARDDVQDQLKISKELTKKTLVNRPTVNDDEASDGDDVVGQSPQVNQKSGDIQIKLEKSTKNPWISFLPTVNVETDVKSPSVEVYRKPEAFVNKEEIERAQNEIDDEDDSDSDETVLPPRETVAKSESESDSDDDGEGEKVEEPKEPETSQPKPKKIKREVAKPVEQPVVKAAPATEIDPTKILLLNDKDEDVDDDDICEAPSSSQHNNKSLVLSTNKSEFHRLTLSEAFADDDVIEEFKVDKKSTRDKEKVKPIDLTLPGWGDWTGAGIDPNEKPKRKRVGNKRRSLVIQPLPHEQNRRDKKLKNVIISEQKDTKIASYQISDLPHQFKNVEEFEKKLSQPIGRTWNPEVKYQKLTQPKIKTQSGAIIVPIDQDDALKMKKSRIMNRKKQNKNKK